MKTFIFAAICALALSVTALAQNKSVYTSTTTKSCKTVKSSTKGAGYYVGRCPGMGGYNVELLEDDIRQTLNVIAPSGKRSELNFWAYFHRFSAVGEKIEWRTKKGVPVALIARFNVSQSDENNKNDSYLMVSKIGKSKSCVTDIVKPGPKQNETARELADVASTKPCKAPDQD